MTDKAKLEKIKKLADAMYNAAFNLTTDASLLRKAMDDYHQFTIYEYHKKEPVSEDTMTIRKEWFEHCKESWYNEGYIDGKYNRDRQFKEPVSEGLEEAAVEAFKEIVDDERNSFLEIFKAGANWKKEQMMAKAVDGEVGYWNLRGLSVNVELPHSIEEGDKVKVIVIKEN